MCAWTFLDVGNTDTIVILLWYLLRPLRRALYVGCVSRPESAAQLLTSSCSSSPGQHEADVCFKALLGDMKFQIDHIVEQLMEK